MSKQPPQREAPSFPPLKQPDTPKWAPDSEPNGIPERRNHPIPSGPQAPPSQPPRQPEKK
jgi:hypothetical protein